MPIGLTGADFFPLRAQNIYSPSGINGGNQSPLEQQPDDIMSLIQKLYQPQHAISDQFAAELQNIPQREHPSKLRMIGAALAGLGAGAGPAAYHGGAALGFRGNPKEAMEVTDQALNQPYYNKLADFNLRVGTLGKGAAEEEKRNINARSMAEQTASRVMQERGQANTLRHQLETEQLANTKNENIKDQKINELTEKAREADNKLNFAMDDAQRKQGNAEAELKLKQAQLDALNARHQLDIAQKDKALAEQKRLHDDMASKWEAEKKDRETRLKQYEEQLGINKDKAKLSTETKVETKDASGKTTGTKVTTKGPVKQEEERVTVYDLKTGKNVATIPKSNVAKLDKTKYGVR